MKQFCQYFFYFNCFFSLLLGLTVKANANQGTIGCALAVEKQTLGGLPEFSANSQPLIGYACDSTPRRSTYLGNWFPSLPQLSFSKTNRALNSDQDSAEADDYSQSWYIDLAIKRFGKSQLVLHGEQKEWQNTLTANEDIPFFSANAANLQDGTLIQNGQQARLLYSEDAFGLSFIFPYREGHPLTSLTLQQRFITQPIQANIAGLPKRSLYNAHTRLTEVGISSKSYEKGFNLNWGVALAVGDITPDSEAIANSNSEYNEVFSVYAGLELYYQHRFNRRWFTFGRWQGDIHYWRQGKNDNEDYQLAEVNNIEQRLHLGLGFSF